MSSKRKLKRRNPAPVAGFKYERMCQAVSEQAIYRVLAVAMISSGMISVVCSARTSV